MNPKGLAPRRDAGFTLIEMLVAIVLSAIVGSILVTITFAAQRSVKNTTAQDDVNAEARVALNRISRDLRQATAYTDSTGLHPAITSVQNPDGAGHVTGAVTSLTFDADFNGDGCLAGIPSNPLPGATSGTVCNPAKTVDPSNPETVTYCWGGSSDPRVYLVAGAVNPGTCTASSGAGAPPLLSGKVSAFEFYYRSNLYRYDANADGITTWSELDSGGAPGANNNGILDTELPLVDSVVLRLTVSSGPHTQSYNTQIDLRDVA